MNGREQEMESTVDVLLMFQGEFTVCSKLVISVCSLTAVKR
jgi:hypothetical protein